MLSGDAPRTVDDAELAGWAGLTTRCPACRVITEIPFRLVRRRTRRRDLAEIKARVVCARCGGPAVDIALFRRVPRAEKGPPMVETLAL